MPGKAACAWQPSRGGRGYDQGGRPERRRCHDPLFELQLGQISFTQKQIGRWLCLPRARWRVKGRMVSEGAALYLIRKISIQYVPLGMFCVGLGPGLTWSSCDMWDALGSKVQSSHCVFWDKMEQRGKDVQEICRSGFYLVVQFGYGIRECAHGEIVLHGYTHWRSIVCLIRLWGYCSDSFRCQVPSR